MRSLAFKIFLGFWTIHALIFVLLALVAGEYQTAGLREAARSQARLAAGLLEDGGPSFCTTVLANTGRTFAADVTLYDSSLAAVCRSRAEIDDRPYRDLVAGATANGVVSRVAGREVCAVAVTTPQGKSYRFVLAATSRAPLDPARPRFGLAMLLIVVLISGVVCLVLAWYLAAPLRKMREATHRLREGDLSARAGVASRNDEIGDVVRDFDLMADRVQSLVQGQKQLLSDISHELRSPLARLGVAVELARRAAGGAAEAHLARIEAEAGRMNDLIGRLLELSREEHAGAAPQHVEFDVAEVASRIATDAQYEAARAGKRVDLSTDGRALVLGDAGLAASAIDNVVRNAVQYTAPGTAVRMRVARSGPNGQVELSVRDHGPGLPAEELERIFLPFYRVDASRNRESGGIGLGLSIARRAVAVMGGSISASNADGGGLLVTISLPGLDG